MFLFSIPGQAQWLRVISLDYAASVHAPLGVGITLIDVSKTSLYLSIRASPKWLKTPDVTETYFYEPLNPSNNFSLTGKTQRVYLSRTAGLSHSITLNAKKELKLRLSAGAGYGYNYFMVEILDSPTMGNFAGSGNNLSFLPVKDKSYKGFVSEASIGIDYKRFGAGIGFSNIAFNSNTFDFLLRLSFVYPTVWSDVETVEPE
ncbi:MAG: hypothetical protein V4543_18280 [Bacteroidota bacterium]